MKQLLLMLTMAWAAMSAQAITLTDTIFQYLFAECPSLNRPNIIWGSE